MPLRLEKQTPARDSRLRSNLLAAVCAVGLTAVLTAVIYIRAAPDSEAVENAPMPVAVEEFAVQDGYQRELSFLGLTRAGRISSLGFEVPGTVARVEVREGTPVVAGDILAELDTAQLESRRAATEADMSQVSAQLELATLRAKRQKNLSATGAVSKEAFDETRLSAKALAAQLQAVQARLRGIDIDLEKSVLRAPYDGTIAQRQVNAGAVVSAGMPVLSLVASGKREAHIGIPVEKAAQLVEGDIYPLTLRGEVLQSTLRSIRPDVDPATLTTTAVFLLPPQTRALDGEPISLSLPEPVQMRGGWLPIAALLEGERGIWTVLRLTQEHGVTSTAREVVEVLEVRGNRAYVRGTLIDRQRVISDGVHRIAPGTAVQPLES
jgi:RND family efflux transporter MFP subunit